jgi:hypothetical protein
MLLGRTQPIPRLVASMPHSFEAVMQQARSVTPAMLGIGHLGASGGGGTQVAPLSVPQVPVTESAQQAGGNMKPGTWAFVQCVAPHEMPATAGAAADPACAADGAPARGAGGVPALPLTAATGRVSAREPATWRPPLAAEPSPSVPEPSSAV